MLQDEFSRCAVGKLGEAKLINSMQLHDLNNDIKDKAISALSSHS